MMRKRDATSKKPNGSLTLSQESHDLLADLLMTISKIEQEIELKRQYLAQNENFEPYRAFQRLDRGETGFLGPKEFLNYLRDNGLATNVTEADCYYVIKFFDSEMDGRINYPDFMQLILPCTNSRLREQATQRYNIPCSKYEYLTLDVEKELSELILTEIKMHRQTEEIKQELEASKGYTREAAFAAVDDCALAYVYQKNLERYLNAQFRKTGEQDHFAIIRRMDLDADQKINEKEFIEAITPQEPFSKMLIRSRIANREPRKHIKTTQPASVKNKKVNPIQKPQSAILMSTKKKNMRDKSNDMKVFKQEALPTGSLDVGYDRQLSISPLKYRPEVNWDGFTDLRPSGTKKDDKSNKKRVMTPDLVHTTPGKSMSPDNGFSRKRSNSRKSILKSNRSVNQNECVSPQITNRTYNNFQPQSQPVQPNFVLPGGQKNTVSFADLTNRRAPKPIQEEYYTGRMSDNKPMTKPQISSAVDNHRNFTHYNNERSRSPQQRMQSSNGVGSGLNSDLYEKSAPPNMNYQNSISGNPQQRLQFYGVQEDFQSPQNDRIFVQSGYEQRRDGGNGNRQRNHSHHSSEYGNSQTPQYDKRRESSPFPSEQNGADLNDGLNRVDEHTFYVLEQQLELEKRIEKIKIQLSLKTDFNLIDAFRLFTESGFNSVSVDDLRHGLRVLGLDVSLDELALFMKRFDQDFNQQLKYTEFCQAFLPQDAFHASLLAKKAPLTMYPQDVIPKQEIFYPETTELFLQAWTTHCQNEISAEQLRLLTQKKMGYSAHTAFQLLDANNDNQIDKEDLRGFFARHSLYVPEKEIQALIERYDKSLSGSISYSEFLSELSAKRVF